MSENTLNIKLDIKDLLVVFKSKSQFDGGGTYMSIAVQNNHRNNQAIAEALVGLGVKLIDRTNIKAK